jgi:hypothetical protein
MPFNLAAFFFLASAQVRGVCTLFTCFTGTNVYSLYLLYSCSCKASNAPAASVFVRLYSLRAQVRGVCTLFTCFTGTLFTCFTGTNVQILTRQALQGEGYFSTCADVC